jgi:hypothetical protein
MRALHFFAKLQSFRDELQASRRVKDCGDRGVYRLCGAGERLTGGDNRPYTPQFDSISGARFHPCCTTNREAAWVNVVLRVCVEA